MSNIPRLLQPKYRPDIDGLRAVAVLAVVAFHFFPNLMKGGFIGVDVFFVISGYLISHILYENLDKGTFSFAEFYARRVRRIFPALLVVLFATFAFGWFTQLADEFRQLSKHVAAGAGFVSNFVLWSESGYFDESASAKPLLHLWSLGIEEQFYIIWPILLWISWKLGIGLWAFPFFLAVVSFTLNALGVNHDPVATFYSPQTRFWELLTGSLLAWITIHKKDVVAKIGSLLENYLTVHFDSVRRHFFRRAWLPNILAFVGGSMLASGLLRIHKDFMFPGFWAIVPTLATVLIILSGPTAWANRVFLSNRVLVWFGTISFPLYLWHWPFLTFLRAVEGEEPTRTTRIAVVLLSIFAAWITFRIIEMPARNSRNTIALTRILVLGMFGIGVLGYASMRAGGYPQRDVQLREDKSISSLRPFDEFKDMEKLYGSKSCFRHREGQSADMFTKNGCLEIKRPGQPVVFLIGDSHSASLSLGLKPIVEKLPVNFMQVSSGWCEPTNNNVENKTCEEINALVVRTLKQRPVDLLIIDAYWLTAALPPYFLGGGDFSEHLKKLINSYVSLGVKKIFVIGQIPTWRNSLPKQIANNFVKKGLSIPKRTYQGIDQRSLDFDSVLRKIELPAEASYFSLRDLLCDETGCLIRVGENIDTDIVVWDYGHLTPVASSFVAEALIKNELLKVLKIEMRSPSLSPSAPRSQ